MEKQQLLIISKELADWARAEQSLVKKTNNYQENEYYRLNAQFYLDCAQFYKDLANIKQE